MFLFLVSAISCCLHCCEWLSLICVGELRQVLKNKCLFMYIAENKTWSMKCVVGWYSPSPLAPPPSSLPLAPPHSPYPLLPWIIPFHWQCYYHTLQELYRKVRGILNKLTPQKFQTLTQQILDLEIETPERLEGVIDLIFEKVSLYIPLPPLERAGSTGISRFFFAESFD